MAATSKLLYAFVNTWPGFLSAARLALGLIRLPVMEHEEDPNQTLITLPTGPVPDSNSNAAIFEEASTDFIQLCKLVGKEVAARGAALEQVALAAEREPDAPITELTQFAYVFGQFLEQNAQLVKAVRYLTVAGKLPNEISPLTLAIWKAGYPDMELNARVSNPCMDAWKVQSAHNERELQGYKMPSPGPGAGLARILAALAEC